MNFKKLLELLEKGENLTSPLSGIIGNVSGIFNMLGINALFKRLQFIVVFFVIIIKKG